MNWSPLALTRRQALCLSQDPAGGGYGPPELGVPLQEMGHFHQGAPLPPAFDFKSAVRRFEICPSEFSPTALFHTFFFSPTGPCEHGFHQEGLGEAINPEGK